MEQAATAEDIATPTERARSRLQIAGFSLGELALLALIAVLAWRVIVVNMSDYYAQQRTPEDARKALSWYGEHPKALMDLALEPGLDSAERLSRLRAASLANPTEGRLYAALALQAEADQAPELATQAMKIAIELAPRHSTVRLTAYQFWLRQNDLTRALESASVVLSNEPQLAKELHPQLLRLMAHPQSDAAFAALLGTPLKWWPGFFSYVSARAPNADVLRALYAMQVRGPNPVDEPQLRAYLGRLQRDGYWMDAYFMWLDSLPPDGLGFTSELHNGGLEHPTRNLGFEWIDQPVKGVLVGFDPTYGTTGSRALHVVFQGLKARWRHFNQYLMLQPGEYSFRGRVRLDSLKTERGVHWRIDCLKAPEPLTTTERFKGTEQWRHFTVSFTVPDTGCAVQDLRLELVGKAQLDFVADGQIWFDDLAIVRR